MADNRTISADSEARRQRVKRLKKLIILLLITSILLPTVLCAVLFARVGRIQNQVEELKELIGLMQAAEGQDIGGNTQMELPEQRNTGEVRYTYAEGSEAAKEPQVLEEKNERKVYLTFDDGPSSYTDEILDILAEYEVEATFFVVGKLDETSIAAYQRIVEEGHTLGMHSYSHKYGEIYQSVDSYQQDLTRLQEYLYQITGVWSRYVRFPGGSSNKVSDVDMQDLVTYLDENGITYFDWNVSSGDSAKGEVSVQTIVDNVMNNVEQYDNVVILMHDAASKKTTVEALPVIIEKLLGLEDTSLLKIDADTIPVQHLKKNN